MFLRNENSKLIIYWSLKKCKYVKLWYLQNIISPKNIFALMIFRINWNPIMILKFDKRNKTLSKINETNLKNKNL